MNALTSRKAELSRLSSLLNFYPERLQINTIPNPTQPTPDIWGRSVKENKEIEEKKPPEV